MIFFSSQEARGTKCYKCLLDSILLYYLCTEFGVLWFGFLVKLFGTNGASHLTYCLALWSLVTFVKQLRELSTSKCPKFQKWLLALSCPFKVGPQLNHSGKTAISQTQYYKNNIMTNQRLFPLLSWHFTVRGIGRYCYSPHPFSSFLAIISSFPEHSSCSVT